MKKDMSKIYMNILGWSSDKMEKPVEEPKPEKKPSKKKKEK